jgi:hypothetical protein
VVGIGLGLGDGIVVGMGLGLGVGGTLGIGLGLGLGGLVGIGDGSSVGAGVGTSVGSSDSMNIFLHASVEKLKTRRMVSGLGWNSSLKWTSHSLTPAGGLRSASPSSFVSPSSTG